MEQRIYHGNITPTDVARNLVAHFSRGNLQAQQIGSGSKITVQIATKGYRASGGDTAMTVILETASDGLMVQVGQQSWIGIAASLGQTALAVFQNPFNLIGRLDDLAQDVESMQITEQVWSVIESTTRAAGAGFELSERLRRSVCPYCDTANPVGQASCVACGAPLGGVQPFTCSRCGFVLRRSEAYCPNCGVKLK